MAAYTQLSQLLTAYPELAFFRTWQTTNNELLLRQQADLTVQEFELEAARKKYAGAHRLSWLDIRRAHCDSEAGRLRARYDDFQRDLRLFRSDLLQTVQINKLLPPTADDRKTLWQWLCSEDEKPGGLAVEGCEVRPWDLSRYKDVVLLGSQPDRLDRYFGKWFTIPYHSLVRRWRKPHTDEEKAFGLRNYDQKYFVRVADIFAILASALVPAASMLVLYIVHPMWWRFGIIVAFLLVFAAVVMLCFNVGRANTFAATLAFAAIQVVFVQGVDGKGQK